MGIIRRNAGVGLAVAAYGAMAVAGVALNSAGQVFPPPAAQTPGPVTVSPRPPAATPTPTPTGTGSDAVHPPVTVVEVTPVPARQAAPPHHAAGGTTVKPAPPSPVVPPHPTGLAATQLAVELAVRAAALKGH